MPRKPALPAGCKGVDLVALILLGLAMVYAWLKPIWDWDIIPYLALGKVWGGMDWPTTHTWVYEWVRTLPDFWRTDLLEREFYRGAVAADPESLQQVSVFYQARLGYYSLLEILQSLGLSATHAAQSINLVGQVILGSTIWLWLRPRVGGVWWKQALWALLFAFLIFNPTTLKMARWSSPDGLVAALYVLGIYLVVHRHHVRWPLLAWLAMVLLRPNTALWLLPLGIWALAAWRPLALGLLGLGLVAAGIQAEYPNYPLAILWQHSFGFPYVYPKGVALDWEFDVYRTTWLNRLAQLHGRDLLVWLVMLSGTLFVWLKHLPIRMLALAISAGACLQILAFPAFWERYYAGPALAVLLIVITANLRERTN